MQKFKSLVESWFLELGPTLTLYYGSSSGKLSTFKSEGIKVPRGSHREFLFNLADKVWREWGPRASSTITPSTPIPEWVIQKLEYYYSKRASASVPDDSVGYIYTSYKKQVAIDYARKYAQSGAELPSKPYWYIGQYLKTKFGFDIPPVFSDADPIVLTLEIPWDDVIVPLETSGKFRDFVARVVSDGKSSGMSLDAIEAEFFPASDWRAEVLVTRDIPVSSIVSIETV